MVKIVDEINCVFNEFLNGTNSKFVDLEYEGTIYTIRKKNKATISKGDINYLWDTIIRIIIHHRQNKS